MDKETLTSNNHAPRPMRPEDASYGDVIMHFSDQPVKPKYWFEDFGDYWSCSCGQINRSDTCSNCGLERELLRRLFQSDALGASAAVNVGKIDSVDDLPSGEDAPYKSSDSNSATGINHGSEPHGASAQTTGTNASAGSGNAGDGTTPDDPANGDARNSEIATKASGANDIDGQIHADLYEEQEQAKYLKRKRRTKRVMIFLLVLVFMLGGGLAAFYYYAIPEMNRQEDLQVNAAKDSLIRELPGILAPFGEVAFDIDRNLGDHYYNNKSYEKAIEHYNRALKIKDDDSLRHKINAAKYSYVSTHREEGGAVFEEYLDDLHKIKYSGIQDIYNTYYAWKASTIVNTGANDYSTDMSSINRINTIYFHTTFSGGPPEETLDLYYEIVWPDGTSERKAVSGSKGSGETLTTTCQYTFPTTPNEGRLTYKIFNNSNNKQLATDSVSLL